MSESSYEKCHTSHRGYMSNEIDTAREVLRKHKKLCVDSVKELRDKTDMPMSECCDMLRCLWRDAKLERIQAENAKLRELVRDVYTLHWNGLDCTECPWFDECDTTGGCPWLSIFTDHMRELGIEVTS